MKRFILLVLMCIAGSVAKAQSSDNGDGTFTKIDENSHVSMNMWGFTPAVYRNIRKDFDAFIEQNGQDLKASFTIPDFINGMIKQVEGIVRTYETSAIWMGVVSPDDKIQTILKINELIRKGVYPMKLFENDDEIRN